MRSSTGLYVTAALSLTFAGEGSQSLLEDYGKLPTEKQILVLKEVETAVQELDTTLGKLVENILAREEAPKGTPELGKGTVWFDPKIYAPGLPIARTLLEEGSRAMEEAKRKYGGNRFPDPLAGRFRYLPGQNKIVRLHKKEAPSLALAQMLEGYPSGAALAREIAFAVIDDSSAMDATADYFAHAYTDRDGGVYPGITIYDVWDSGFEIEMPDVDAIPFARNILKDNSYKSPIPDGPARTRLYQHIGEHFRDFRRYLVLREAIASWFFTWDAKASPLVDPLRDRVQFLIAWGAGDPFMLRQFLSAHPTREDLIREVDKLMTELEGQAWALLQKRQAQMEADRKSIREAAQAALKNALAR